MSQLGYSITGNFGSLSDNNDKFRAKSYDENMQTLVLLSSSKLLPLALKTINRPANTIRLAHIITASKDVKDLSYLDRTRAILNGLGVQYEDMDIEGKDEAELLRLFNSHDAIFVNGGNTFYLLKAVRESGFDKVVKQLLDKGTVYIGASAGSYICCPTIETSFWKTSPKDMHDTHGMTDFTGMNLVPFIMKVHYVPEEETYIREKVKTATKPVKILTDEQGLLVRDGKVELIGNGQEISIRTV